MDRAHSVFTVKSVREDERVITGIASTPALDRDGDEVLPTGAEFSLPLPLLWQHDQRSPVGHVTSATARPDGIHVTAQLARVDEPGRLKDRLDEAWHSIKHGLVRGLSIGFRGLDFEPIPRTGGKRYTKWSWLELSCVCIPANMHASILTVKAADVAPGTKPRFHHSDLLPAMRMTAGLDPKFAKMPVTGAVLMTVVEETIAQFKADRQHHARLFARRKEIFDDMETRMLAVEARVQALEDAQ